MTSQSSARKEVPDEHLVIRRRPGILPPDTQERAIAARGKRRGDRQRLMATPNQRGFYRIEYPIGNRPTLLVGERTLEVIDCSESGLRYAHPESDPHPLIDSEVRGTLRFREGQPELDVEGAVARVYGRSVAVRFTTMKIPFSTILAEQRRLRREYLTHLTDP